MSFHWNRGLLWLSIGAGDNETYVSLHVERHCCTIFNKFVIFGQVLIEVPKVKFHITSSSWIRSDKCGQTDRQTDGQGEAKWCFHDCTRGTKLHGSSKLSDSMELSPPPFIVW